MESNQNSDENKAVSRSQDQPVKITKRRNAVYHLDRKPIANTDEVATESKISVENNGNEDELIPTTVKDFERELELEKKQKLEKCDRTDLKGHDDKSEINSDIVGVECEITKKRYKI
ncbi:MAG: hypothetical protein HRK26_05610 [Rickettsiaceae bacterium H1]|nr:hypothetical protein [Rickettsiaceae bacterium H1]